MQYVIRPTNSDLQHHGILGQKWGQKNGPPYPLGASNHSAAEKKAGWRNSISKVNNKGNDPLNLPMKNKDFSSLEDCQNVNKSKNKINNCSGCAYTWELRRRGYDVSITNDDESVFLNADTSVTNMASKFLKNGKPVKAEWADDHCKQSDITTIKLSNGTDFTMFTNDKALDRAYGDYPDDSRGICSFIWSGSYALTGSTYGHYINWEKTNGKLKFYDSQAGIEMSKRDICSRAIANSMQSIMTNDTEIDVSGFKEMQKLGGIK